MILSSPSLVRLSRIGLALPMWSLAPTSETFHTIASAVMPPDFLSVRLVSAATTARSGFITARDAQFEAMSLGRYSIKACLWRVGRALLL